MTTKYFRVAASVYVWADDAEDALDRAKTFERETEKNGEGIAVYVSEDEAEFIENAAE